MELGMNDTVWQSVFQMFTTMMQQVWRFFQISIGGVQIWEIYVLLLFFTIAVGFVVSFYNRDGHSD